MTTVDTRSWFGGWRRGGPAGTSRGDAPWLAVGCRAARNALERFVLDELERRGPRSRAALVIALSRWIARRERSMGSGVLDLVILPDRTWAEEAERALRRLEGDLFEAPSRDPAAAGYP